jgi:hypothetical protein
MDGKAPPWRGVLIDTEIIIDYEDENGLSVVHSMFPTGFIPII